MLTAVSAVESVELKLEDSEISRATVSVNYSSDTVYISNTKDFSAIADSDTEEVYFSIRIHNYTSVEGLDDSVSNGSNLVDHRLTKAEAQALITVLSNELAKL